MFKLALVLITLSTSMAFAHVEPGTYKGKLADGSVCSMVASATFFDGGMKHPLNERIKIQVGKEEYSVGHPALVNAAESLASFNHDLFQGVLPTVNGANALVIEMVHTETQEGPIAFTHIVNNWKTGEKVAHKCSDLNLTK